MKIIYKEEEKKKDISKLVDAFINTNWSKSPEDAGKAINLLKGLVFSKDPKAQKFIKDLDKLSNSMKADTYK